MTEIPDSDPIIEILYGEKKILNSKYTKIQIDAEKVQAQKINELMGRKIFDYQFFKTLQNSPHYKPIEKAYTYILNCILERTDCFKDIKLMNYHLIVTGGLDLRSDSNGKDVFILLEWPLIKYIDLLNTSIFCARDFNEYYIDCKAIVNTYKQKFIEKNNCDIFSSIYDKEQFTPVQYQIMQLFQQIQSIFIISHELGHILNPNDIGIAAEITADLTALRAVKEYVYNNTKMTAWIIIAIMLLYSYLTLLDVGTAEDHEGKVKRRESWLERYDMVLDQLQELPVDVNEQELISGYDIICTIIDNLCLEIIDE
ncbi:MAG: hypothetical protein K2G55_03540 [Lachnospiraceae bacterium]|nr:hypothetical protein [Lachnospiraceae bacterium]MDE7205277.1 hypothetical protein [Lachnospiraceae bacterium]